MRHADVNEVFYARAASGINRASAGSQIHVAELSRFGWIGMGNSDQLNKRVGGCDLVSEGLGVEGISSNHLTTWRKFFPGSRPHQGANFMSSIQQAGDKRAANVTGASGDKNAMMSRVHKDS